MSSSLSLVKNSRSFSPNPELETLVYIVDDDDGMRLMTESTLAAAGFDVREFSSAEDVLRACEVRVPDMILSDVMMPNMDGFELCSRLRRVQRLNELPVVLLTSLDDTHSIEKAFAVGATDFILKPIVWSLLPHRVRYLLRSSQSSVALRRSEERFALAANGANDGLWDCDLETRYTYFSPRWKEMLGLSEHELKPTLEAWFELVHAEDRARVELELHGHLERRTEHFESEHRLRKSDGDYIWVVARGLAVGDDSGVNRIAGSFTDITARKEAESQLLHDALHDKLTGLPNRSLFLDRLSHCIDVAKRKPDFRFAVLFIDLDRFKVINDSLGHLQGDLFLIEVGRRLSSILRSGDTLARLGGDEFVFILEDISETSDATRLATRIQDALAVPFTLNEQSVVSGASMGISVSWTGYEQPQDMLRDADAAMYRAKARRKGTCEVFDQQMHTEAVHALRLESELRGALDRQEFAVHYQPIVDLASGETCGVEALLRWVHPRDGLLLPEKFLSVAEETNLIVPIGRWVLAEACGQLQRWRTSSAAAQEWFVSVNLSSQELAQPDILEAIGKALTDSDLPAARLRLEMTEGSLIKNNAHSHEVLNELKSRGIQLAIDDFGTGYSSLNYLHRYPFNTLKLDRSFVHSLDTDVRQREIVRAVIELAHNLGLEVVAEGSETAEVLSELAGLNCEFAQGFAISRALTPIDVESEILGVLKPKSISM
ncbi:MAG: EAL domain-containing protein [Gammaproteobacteria bacterium]|nr:EAL domain-containing protein [Gammaproteobacteria bacterium]